MHVHVATVNATSTKPDTARQAPVWYYLAQADKKEKGIKTVLCGLLADENAHVCRPSPYRPSRAPAIGVNDGRSTAPGIEKMLPLAGHHKGCQTGAHHLRQTPPVDGN